MNIKTEIKEYGFPVTHNCVRSETRIAELEAQLAAAQAEITRLRAGGCAREQRATQYCGEMQAMVVTLTTLAEEWREENCYDKGRRETLDWCADRLREAIIGTGTTSGAA